jgi:ligand-binding SRPBCC domain-containing protein
MTVAGYRMNEQHSLRHHTLERRQTLPAPLERVFPFFENPENLALITPPSLRCRLVMPGPVTMQEGLRIDYTIRLGGMPVRWRSLISLYDPPVCFVDEQVKGPYAYWRHMHRFESTALGTVLTDAVVYALPAAMPPLVERIVHSLYVRPNLERIFDYRANFYADFFGGQQSELESESAAPRAATPMRS